MHVFLGVDAVSGMKPKDGRKIKLPENMIISKLALKVLDQEDGRKV
jgi:hypothetical protein